MIKEKTPLTLAEVSKLAGEGEKAEQTLNFIKQFVRISYDKTKEIKEGLEKLQIIKLKEEHITKIVNFTPEDAIDLNKILQDVSLDQTEVDKILNVVKKN